MALGRPATLGAREVTLIGGEAYLRDDLAEIVALVRGGQASSEARAWQPHAPSRAQGSPGLWCDCQPLSPTCE
ncbi:MAG: hypothetical protein WKG00_26610 [Polyangiaceae bacterium]